MPISNLPRYAESVAQSIEEKLNELFPSYTGRPPEDAGILGESPFSGPVGKAGMVMNPKNARILANKILNFNFASGGRKLNPVQTAIAYMKAKYPRLTKIPNQFIVGNLDPKESGRFLTDINSVFVNESQQKVTSDAIKTLGHELTHALQFKKNPKVFQNYTLGSRENPRMFSDYFDQPVEVGARQGGATARKTYEKFLELLGK